jgi:hypothetical protein
MPIINDGPTGTIDRIAGAIIALALVSITLVFLPIAILVKLNAHHSLPFYYPYRFLRHVYSLPFFVWVILVSLGSAVYGALLGSMGVLIQMSPLWGSSCDERETYKLWSILLICTAISIFLYLLFQNSMV